MRIGSLENLKYPIGKYKSPPTISIIQLNKWIDILENFPDRLSVLTSKLHPYQLDTLYRPDGWSIRQVIHHLADSHFNSYVRFKWTLTENELIIKAYYEDKWAELADSKTAPIQLSLQALHALHSKWLY